MSDEGFREIQLNGKQLVFMFMAVTVVLVVTFLFGVLVGRGAREGTAPAEIASNEVAPDPAAAPSDNAAPPAAQGSSTAQTPAAPAEELSYAERLLRDAPPQETLKPAADASRSSPPPAPVVQEPVEKAPVEKAPAPRLTLAPAERPAAVAPVPRSTPATSVPAPIVAAPATDPSGPGFAVQVAAYRDRRDADTLAKQLSAKGYPAFVMDPVKGTSTALFRVRVGKYKTLKDAEAIEARLQTAEQLTNAWIAR